MGRLEWSTIVPWITVQRGEWKWERRRRIRRGRGEGDRIGIFAWYRLASLVPARWIRIPMELRLEKVY